MENDFLDSEDVMNENAIPRCISMVINNYKSIINGISLLSELF